METAKRPPETLLTMLTVTLHKARGALLGDDLALALAYLRGPVWSNLAALASALDVDAPDLWRTVRALKRRLDAEALAYTSSLATSRAAHLPQNVWALVGQDPEMNRFLSLTRRVLREEALDARLNVAGLDRAIAVAEDEALSLAERLPRLVELLLTGGAILDYAQPSAGGNGHEHV